MFKNLQGQGSVVLNHAGAEFGTIVLQTLPCLSLLHMYVFVSRSRSCKAFKPPNHALYYMHCTFATPADGAQ